MRDIHPGDSGQISGISQADAEKRALSDAARALAQMWNVWANPAHIRKLEAHTQVARASQSELAGSITELQAGLREYTLRIENKAIKEILKGTRNTGSRQASSRASLYFVGD